MSKTIICVNCSQEKKHKAKQLCEACYDRLYRKQNLERRRATEARYFQNNRDKVHTRKNRWRLEHLKQARQCERNWERNNPERKAAADARLRARKHLLPDTFSGAEAKQLLSTLPCFYCGKKIDLTLDHFVPISRGGGTTRAQMVVACASCNSRKYDKLPEEIIRQLPFAVPGFVV